METKPRAQSMTWWGIATMAIGMIGQIILADKAVIDSQLIAWMPDFIDPYVPAIVFSIGTALAGYGRDRAEKKTSGWIKKQ